MFTEFVVCDRDNGEEPDDNEDGVDWWRFSCCCCCWWWCSRAVAAKCNWCWRAPIRNGTDPGPVADELTVDPAKTIAAAVTSDVAEQETAAAAWLSPEAPPVPLLPADWAVWDSDEIELVSWCWMVLCWPCDKDTACWCCWLLVVCELMTMSAAEVTEAEEDAAEEVNIEVGFSDSALVEDDEVDGATQQLENGLKAVGPIAEDQVLVSCRHTECHIEVR